RKRPSLGREIFEKDFAAILSDKSISIEDRLCTFTESAAKEICRAIKSHLPTSRVLCTGGGAFNSYLISRMLEHGGDDITLIIPDEEVVKFKEALVFGFLGVLRVRGEVNCLKTVTNAVRDSSSGIMIGF
ncbi:MAG: anhydro-N-acetylmuramic acid kinase, partial [Bacteroidota bacterium]|nr:anhydro-N-acetylmuramic acid kinase [Bacteroidota bacterium]